MEVWLPVQDSLLPACIHPGGSSRAPRLCHAVFSVYMVSIHSEDCRSVPSTGFTFNSPPCPPHSPSCVFCTPVMGDRARVLGTQLHRLCGAFPLCRGRGVKEDWQEAERGQCFSLMIPLSSQCLEDNTYGIKGKNRSNWFRNMSLMLYFECWSILRCWYVGKINQLFMSPTLLLLEPISSTKEPMYKARWKRSKKKNL